MELCLIKITKLFLIWWRSAFMETTKGQEDEAASWSEEYQERFLKTSRDVKNST